MVRVSHESCAHVQLRYSVRRFRDFLVQDLKSKRPTNGPRKIDYNWKIPRETSVYGAHSHSVDRRKFSPPNVFPAKSSFPLASPVKNFPNDSRPKVYDERNRILVPPLRIPVPPLRIPVPPLGSPVPPHLRGSSVIQPGEEIEETEIKGVTRSRPRFALRTGVVRRRKGSIRKPCRVAIVDAIRTPYSQAEKESLVLQMKLSPSLTPSMPPLPPQVNPGSKAAKGGLKDGHVIRGINGTPTSGMTNRDAHAAIKDSPNTLLLTVASPVTESSPETPSPNEDPSVFATIKPRYYHSSVTVSHNPRPCESPPSPSAAIPGPVSPLRLHQPRFPRSFESPPSPSAAIPQFPKAHGPLIFSSLRFLLHRKNMV
ncbi:unnamed protein product [Darwinula stevensoni]|uniref:PDZ domain-containing protein n=1 Tax=Darwinula stevensoni TaxID=69355 RepID=A0A7R9A7A2_9CRUS|nr:unnamed protein product [Darwinula stevensoni]CAG0890897.1 unnamed protein product [Darwinula stevensoni]